jgi:hypothetical protein
MEAIYLVCGARRSQLMRVSLGGNPLSPHRLRFTTSNPCRLLLPVFLLTLACSHGETSGKHPQLELASVVGCYLFSWQHGDSALTGSWVPDLVRLDSTPACPTCPPDAPAASHLQLGTPLPDTATMAPGQPIPWHRTYYASHWLLLRPDTLKVFFNSNHVHWDVRLLNHNGLFRGSGTYWSDGGTFDTAPTAVTARPVPCPS